MAENANWKQVGDIYKTDGSILEIGSFIAQSGNKVDISNSDIDELLQNIDTPIPFSIGHDKYAETIGYAIKFSRDGNQILHNGIVFDSDKFENVILKGHNNISPEIDFIKDSSGKIVGKKIVRLTFVPNPAIKANKTDVTRFAFSAPEVTSMSNDGTPQNSNNQQGNPAQTSEPTTLIQGQQVPVSTFNETNPQTPPAFDPNEFAKNIAMSIAEGLSAKIGGQLESMQQEIAALKSGQVPLQQSPVHELNVPSEPEPIPVNSQDSMNGIPKEIFEQFAKLQAENQTFKSQIERDEKSTYTNKLAELRSLQVENPEKLVSHLKDYKSKIDTLEAFKVTIARNTPMNSPAGASPMSAEGGKKTNKTPTILELADSLRISIDAETTEKLSKRMRLPAQ
jgi:hypothetical protein